MRLNQITGELEGYELLSLNLDNFTVGRIQEISSEKMVAYSPELKKNFILTIRKDLVVDDYALIKLHFDTPVWAMAEDFGASKGGILPAVYIENEQGACEWKKGMEVEDIIIEIDNKSITHRPDLWGHRGFAREVAAILDVPMVPAEEILAKIPVQEYEKTVLLPSQKKAVDITVENFDDCKRVAGATIEAISYRPSLIWMLSRLCRVDSRPISTLVDITNYVMLDIGQPMHAFDATTLAGAALHFKRASVGEKVTLLDGDEVELSEHDLVIKDEQKVLGIAGIMGGISSGVKKTTTSLFIEAGSFNAALIRKTAARFKKRTEASARFEKTLDPNQTVTALERYIYLLKQWGVPFQEPSYIVSVGAAVQGKTLRIGHAFLESRMGVKLDSNFIMHILQKLGCTIEKVIEGTEVFYNITVPTWRSTKDITIQEDILEEIARFYGFTNIEPVLPEKRARAFSITAVQKVRAIKQYMASRGLMHETQNYAMYDEEFLRMLAYIPRDVVSIKNPISENLKHMVTSLIPHLLKNVHTNVNDYSTIRFFEWGRTWREFGQKVDEQRALSGIIFDKKHEVDFYEAKQIIVDFLTFFGIQATWVSCKQPEHVWFAPYQTAQLIVQEQCIGVAGKIDQALLQRITEGDAFIFELDADFLLSYQSPEKKFTPLAKYPSIDRDISMLIPANYTAQELMQKIKAIDSKISQVTLVDFFEKEEWHAMRSLTFRFVLTDPEKTLTKEEADVLWDSAAAMLKGMGATIR